MELISHSYGVTTQEVFNWNEFLEFVNSQLDYRHFIWRGHGDSSWLLSPTLDRALNRISKTADQFVIDEHLSRFKFAIRGRRGANPIEIKSENDWWALGQHYGLATPLLDWTKSPLVAAFFAYASPTPSSTKKGLYSDYQEQLWKINLGKSPVISLGNLALQ